MSWEKKKYGVVITEDGRDFLGEMRSKNMSQYRVWIVGEFVFKNGKIQFRSAILTRRSYLNPTMRKANSQECSCLEGIVTTFGGLKSFLPPVHRTLKKAFREKGFLNADEISKACRSGRDRKRTARKILSSGRREAGSDTSNSIRAVSGGLPEGGKHR